MASKLFQSVRIGDEGVSIYVESKYNLLGSISLRIELSNGDGTAPKKILSAVTIGDRDKRYDDTRLPRYFFAEAKVPADFFNNGDEGDYRVHLVQQKSADVTRIGKHRETLLRVKARNQP